MLVERGRLKAEQAQAFDPVARRQSIESVRALYRQAEAVFLASEKQFGEAEQVPAVHRSQGCPAAGTARASPARFAPVRLALARVLMEIAQTYQPGTPENQANLPEAAKRYGDLYDKHRGDLGGLYARLGQARCCKELGQPDQALAMFVEVVGRAGRARDAGPAAGPDHAPGDGDGPVRRR